jgi:integrase
MGNGEKRLSARYVQTAGEGYHADGGGLYLQVTASGARSWILRYQLAGRRREMGIGSAGLYGLAQARERAQEARRLLADGIDPIAARDATRARPDRTWGDAVSDYIEAHSTGWRNDSQAQQWRQSLADYGPSSSLPVAQVNTALVVRLLRGIWTSKTETATRLRGRIERVWAAERTAGTVVGENPARWRGHLDTLLPPPAKVRSKRHQPAMPYRELPAFWRLLTARDGISRRALRFTILTVSRTSEVTGANWDEFDLKAKVWILPARRMKAGKEHIVPLTESAIACLADLPRSKPPFRLSENAMLYLLQRNLLLPQYTVHGFRSTFRDWAGETTNHPREVIEHALAHQLRDKAEAAYARGTLLEKRRKLMLDWAAYMVGTHSE